MLAEVELLKCVENSYLWPSEELPELVVMLPVKHDIYNIQQELYDPQKPQWIGFNKSEKPCVVSAVALRHTCSRCS